MKFSLFVLSVALTCSTSCHRTEPEPSPQAEPRPARGTTGTPQAPARPIERIALSLGGKTIEDPAGGLEYHPVGDVSSATGIVILFHGYGAQGDDLVGLGDFIQQRLGDSKVAYLMPAAPFALVRGRAWFKRDRSNFDEGLSYAKAFVKWVRTQHPEAKIVIGGFSQGAMITTNLLSEADDHFAGALVLSPADLITNQPDAQTPRVPVYMSHGTRDQVLPFEGAVALRDRLRAMKYEVSWNEFDGRHQIPIGVRTQLVERVREHLVDAP